MMKYNRIAGTGSSVSDNILTSADLEEIVGAGDVWINERTGIKERRDSLHGKCSVGYALNVTSKRIKLPIDRVFEHIHNYAKTSRPIYPWPGMRRQAKAALSAAMM